MTIFWRRWLNGLAIGLPNISSDFEYEAMFEMINILDEAGIYHAGAGANFYEASQPAIFEVDGTRVALIAFTDNEPDWEATAQQPGIFYVPIDVKDDRAKRLFQIVHQTKKEVNLLIVSADAVFVSKEVLITNTLPRIQPPRIRILDMGPLIIKVL